MAKILLTGGTGVLGRELKPRLIKAGHSVRLMSRRMPLPGEDQEIEWAKADLEKGEGLASALSDVEVVLHAASSATRRTHQIDVEGTSRLLEASKRSGVQHFFYISIVGIEKIPQKYYKHKLFTEQLIESSDLPFTILRATQFHTLIDQSLGFQKRLPFMLVPKDYKFQVIDPGEVARHIVALLPSGPSGRVPDIGGPEVLELGEMTRVWLQAQEKPRRIINLPLFGEAASGFRQGFNTTPKNSIGKITWQDWVNSKFNPIKTNN